MQHSLTETIKANQEKFDKFNMDGMGKSGLENIGNTCFMNSGIQCLSHVIELTKYFLSNSFVKDIPLKDGKPIRKEFLILKEWVVLLQGIWEKNQLLRPVSFKNMISQFYNQFAGTRQHDSHEFLAFLIELLHQSLYSQCKVTVHGTPKTEEHKMSLEALEQWKKYYEKEYSIFIELFYGQEYQTIKPLEENDENYISKNYPPFSYLHLPIPYDKQNKCSIYDCLNYYYDTTILENDNKYYWEEKKKYVKAKKIIKIWKPPKILIISIKRFPKVGKKLGTKIEYPINGLDLTDFVIRKKMSNYLYDLFAISNHIGNYYTGHYFSYCKGTNGEWNEFNDLSISKINSLPNESDTAYVLFYRLRS